MMHVCSQFLAVPVETKVHLYERGSWGHVGTLSDDLLTQVRSRSSSRPLGGHVVGRQWRSVSVLILKLKAFCFLCSPSTWWPGLRADSSWPPAAWGVH